MKRFACIFLCVIFIGLFIGCGKQEPIQIDLSKFDHDEQWLNNLKESEEASETTTKEPDLKEDVTTQHEPTTESITTESTSEPSTKTQTPVEITTSSPVIEEPILEEQKHGYCYTLLSKSQKQYYDILQNAIDTGKEEIVVNEHEVTEDDLKTIIKSVKADRPDLFWIDGFTLYYRQFPKHIVGLKIYYNDLKQNRKAILEDFESIVKEIKEQTLYLSDFEKEKYVHDYLINTCIYQQNDYDQTLYSALVMHETVCAGYAKAFQYLCQNIGLNVLYVSGTVYHNGETEPHAWNIIELNNAYYAVDVTSDDWHSMDTAMPVYMYLNFKESDKTSFIRDDFSNYLPSSNGTEDWMQLYYGVDAETYTLMQNFDISVVIRSLEEFQTFFINMLLAHGYGDYELRYIVSGDIKNEVENWLDYGDLSEELTEIARINEKDSIVFKYELRYVSFSNKVAAVEQRCIIED